MAEAKKENIENNNTMSLIERFKQFMAKVDWSELTIGEKEALYEATYGVPNGDGIPFKVIPGNKEETIRIIYGDEETQLKLRKSDLKKFRKWLEDTYMGKEVGEVWLSMEREREWDEERNLRNTRYTYETNKSVLSALKMFFSLYNIGRDVTISKNGLFQKADYVVYDNLKTHSYAIEDEIRLIYIPEKRLATKWHTDPIPESKWFKDDRTGIYSEMKLFDLKTYSGFPLRISKIILGTKFPYPDENVKQFTARLKETNILTSQKKENVFVRSEIEDYR